MTQLAQPIQKPLWPLAVHAMAGIAVGVMVANWGLTVPRQLGFQMLFQSFSQANVSLLLVVTIVLAAIAVPLVAQSLPAIARSGGWAIAAAGLVLVGVAVQVGMLGRGEVAQFIAMAGIGLALGGAMLAAGAADDRGRIAIALGFVAGVVPSPWLLHTLTKLTGRERIGEMSPAIIHLAIAVLFVCVAGVVAFGQQRGVPEAPAQTSFGFTACVLVASAVLWAGTVLRQMAAEGIRLSRDGIATPKRADASEFVLRYGSAGLAVLIGAIFLWYAYRRGRADAARWVVLCFALAAPIVGGVHTGMTARWPVPHILVGLVAIAAGAFLAVRADRAAPWDAVGAGVVAVATLLSSPLMLREMPDGRTFVALLGIVGVGFALSAGLVRLLRSQSAEPVVAASFALLGFAVMVLSGQALAYVVLTDQLSRPAYGRLPLLLPGLMLLGTVVLVLLFGLRRAIDGIRSHVAAEAQRPS